jgi:5'-deoxynucleotidase YfbR-like HD superfamily hydrolase
MLIVHDAVEIDAGNTFAYDAAGLVDQREPEARAADRMFGLLLPDQAAEFCALWEEFEAQETPEARFAMTDTRRARAWQTPRSIVLVATPSDSAPASRTTNRGTRARPAHP